MRVLITGAGGFIGRHLTVDQLQRGRQVVALDVNVDALAPLAGCPNLQIVRSDFRDAAATAPYLQGCAVCFHLASAHLETGVGKDYFWKVNVEGARDFAARCHQAGVARFVHCSSVGVYGDIEQPPADEESECHPDVAYEKTKLEGEKAVMQYAAEHHYDVVVVRPAWVYGPHCPRTRKLFQAIQKGRFFFVGRPGNLRHPIYIDDFVAGMEAAAAHEEASGEVFILAGPRAVTLEELSSAIADTLGVPRPRLRLPKHLVWSGCVLLEAAAAVSAKPAPFTRRSLKFYTGNTAFSTEKAGRVLGFRAAIDLAEGLRRTSAWLSSGQPLALTVEG